MLKMAKIAISQQRLDKFRMMMQMCLLTFPTVKTFCAIVIFVEIGRTVAEISQFFAFFQ